jgi:hypothetical protein
MNSKIIFPVLFGLAIASATAQEPSSNFDSSKYGLGPTQWNTSRSYWDRILSEKEFVPEMRLGRSDFVVSGPLIHGFRRAQLSSDASWGKKILALPVVSWFVPQRMPSPPGGTGRYFAWNGSRNPWSVATPAGAPGSAFNAAYHEATGTLISIGHSSR